jgi:hypothetical protein
MTGRRAIVGVCMLCALVFSAFAAQSASAASKGTTAFTCVKGQGTLKGEHCLTTGNAAEEYGHVEIAENAPTEIIGTNGKTSGETSAAGLTRLKETIGGVELELTATGVSGTGTMENKKDGTTGEHYAEGSGTIVYSGVEVAKPAGKGCKVFTDNAGVAGTEGIVDTNALKATTKGQGDFLKFEPGSGTTFATFFVSGCSPSVPAIEGTWEITGSLKCPVTGATTVCSHSEITTQNTLKGKGNKAGLEGALTISGRTGGSGAYTPLSATTVETP